MNSENRHQSIQSFFSRYIQELKQDVSKSTGDLSDSISFEETDNGVAINMLSYGRFIEDGINGTDRNVGSIYSFKDKKPPISSISNYAKSIGVNPFALQNSIFKNGVRPKSFIKPNIDNRLNDFANNYSEAIWEDINKDLNNE